LSMEFYDAHIHFSYQCPPDELRHVFVWVFTHPAVVEGK
jgi:hypothetical protein